MSGYENRCQQPGALFHTVQRVADQIRRPHRTVYLALRVPVCVGGAFNYDSQQICQSWFDSTSVWVVGPIVATAAREWRKEQQNKSTSRAGLSNIDIFCLCSSAFSAPKGQWRMKCTKKLLRSSYSYLLHYNPHEHLLSWRGAQWHTLSKSKPIIYPQVNARAFSKHQFPAQSVCCVKSVTVKCSVMSAIWLLKLPDMTNMTAVLRLSCQRRTPVKPTRE